ncbi:MAG: NUDIX hydrolase [Pseudomonadota bacterium]
MESFRDGQFGPLEPLQPYPIDVPEPPGGRPRVRRWLYPVGLNIFQGGPGTEGLMLTNFQMQEDYAEQPSVPRALIESCKNDILNLIGDDLSENIVPTPQAEKAMQGNPGKRKDFESRKDEVLDFFANPDPDGHTTCFSDWLSTLLEDNLVIDAVAVNIQPTAKKGSGPAGSSLGALATVSGDMIKPLIDIHGGRPRPPQSSFQQIAWGIARVDLMDLLADFGPDSTLDDLTALNPILESLMEEADQFGADQLLYCVQNRRPRPAIYGFSPMAQSMLAAGILFARQMWQFQWFQSGSLPAVFLDPGESVATAEEARQLQEAINMLGGDLGARHQVIVIPPGGKVIDQKPVDLTSQIDEWLVALLCMGFGKSISDLGLTPKIAAMMSPAASKGAAKQAADRTTKASTIPRSKCFKDQLFDRVIRKHLGQSDMMWSWGIEEGGESLADKIQQEINLVGGQLSTIDESRIRLGWEPLGLPETTVPIVKIATGVVPLGSPAMEALAEKPEPPTPPGLPPGAGPAGALPPGKPKPPGGGNGNGNGAKPKPPAKPGGSGVAAPVSDAHAGARTAEAAGPKPTDSKGGNGQATKSALAGVSAECEILRRHLKRGRPLDAFVGKRLSPGALHAGAGMSAPDAIVYAVTKAAKRQVRRDAVLDPLRAHVGASVAALGRQVAAGTLTAAAFVPAATGVLSDAYSDAYTAGSDHAAQDLNGTPVAEWDDEATARAQAQVPYLSGFAEALAGMAILAGIGGDATDPASDPSISQPMTLDELAARADLYGSTVTAPYEEAYVTTGAEALDNPVTVWHAAMDDATCPTCETLDGEEFTSEDDLPFWPGDGGFGDDGDGCSGGPLCRCFLEMKESSSPAAATLAESDQPSGARDAQDQIDAMNATGKSYVTRDEALAAFHGATDKDFGAGGIPGPGGPVVVAPFDLTGPGNRRVPNNVGERGKRKKPKKAKAATMTKDAAGYVEKAPAGRRCDQCSMFRLNPPDFESGACTLVQGLIDAGATCDHWEKAGKGKAAPANAVTAEPIAAGLAVRAESTGRVLVLQRALADDDEFGDPAAGKLEFGGGHIEPGELPFEAACREWSEEVGAPCPDGKIVATWQSQDGVYLGFVMSVPDENLPINLDYPRVENPDAPLHAKPETCMWMDVADLIDNPAVRAELALSAPWYELRTPIATDSVTVYRGLSADFAAKATKGMLVFDEADTAAVTDLSLLDAEPFVAAITGLAVVKGAVKIPAGTVLEVVGVDGRLIHFTEHKEN